MGKGDFPAMDMGAAQLDAAMQDREHLAGIEKLIGIEGAFILG